MNPSATVANTLWWASNVPAWFAFRRALYRPAETQAGVLRATLRAAANTAFAREHGLSGDSSYAQFCDRVPLRTYDELSPWIDRVRAGEPNVLTSDPVRRLTPTSGTTGGRKLIPYTASLQRQFSRAIGPWVVDLFHTYPTLLAGRAYWSVSPGVRAPDANASAVPIGFADDSEYVGGWRRRLVEAVLAVPASVRDASSFDAWQRLTADHLRRAADLRLMSIWHPSFLELLPGLPAATWQQRWPSLKLISCWADGHSALAADGLARRFPGVVVQPKGLLATEGVVSIPFAGRWPVAVRSHFYEFIDAAGDIRLTHELEEGHTYEVVLTTAGGLYRYRLGDRVRVEGRVGRTPSIRFVGRAGNVADRFGEKLDEAFVAAAIGRVQRDSTTTWPFAMLAFEVDRYVLFVEADATAAQAAQLDDQLCQNPHYAYCRDLGQLAAVKAIRVAGGDTTFVRRLFDRGTPLGDIKPSALSKLDGWSAYFQQHCCPTDGADLTPFSDRPKTIGW